MKINYNNTALGLLDDINPDKFRIMDDGGATTYSQKFELCMSVINSWDKLKPFFKKNVRYISESFHSAYTRSRSKLADILDKEEIDEGGTIVYKATPSETNTIFYRIKTWGKGSEYRVSATVLVFNNHTSKDKPALAIASQMYPNPNDQAITEKLYASKASVAAGVTTLKSISEVLCMILFLKYCDVETKIIEGNKKIHHAGVKYVNETKTNIQVIDSTWFTTIVRNGSFMVGDETGGFLRWQRWGPGNSQKKLIWVDPFEKEGYTRKAKILNQ